MKAKFDIPKLAAQFAKRHVEYAGQGVQQGDASGTAQATTRRARTLQAYVTRLLERYGRGKSFFIRSEPTPLYDFFVPLDLTTQVRRLSAPGVGDLAHISRCGILIGSGGSGKSMMMRHLLVNSITTLERIPVFLELRQLNQTSDTLRSALVETIRSFGLEIDEASLDETLESGHLIVLLDGFDEVENSSRKKIVREIQRLAVHYPKNLLFMSSRPDSALQGWELFAEYKVAPLTLAKAAELVQKLPYEAEVKKGFIRDMEKGLFNKHRSFLSNPLLLSIMLLTYGDVSHIPHKLSTFYSQAYEALFLRHDALKPGFQRERRSGLDIQEYARAFAAFCLQSYDNREFSFSRVRALEMLAAARAIAMLNFDDEAFLNDAVQAVCLLLEEGLEIAFAHRSFQEYFVARFIQFSPPDIKAKLVERFVPTAEADAVISLLWELDPYIVEKHYLLPKLAQIREIIGVSREVRIVHLRRYLAEVYRTFDLDEDQMGDGIFATAKNSPLHTAMRFAVSRYRNWPRRLRKKEQEHVNARLVEAFKSDFGDVQSIRVNSLKARGQFLSALADSSGMWGKTFLEDLLEIEREIRAKHATNQESLEQLLATHRPPKG